ncbi:MAG: hypothetical protein Kow00106_17580 [Anaerolineae bacterium]
MSHSHPQLAFDLDRDVRALVAMAAHLTPWLYEDELYGYVGGNLPRLTLGGLLLRLYRLERLGSHLSAEQLLQVQGARAQFDQARSQWAVHYEQKLRRELEARVHAFEQFLTDCEEDLSACALNYPVQAEKRTIIHHLVQEASALEIFENRLHGRIKELDRRLQGILQQGECLADERLCAVYSPTEFWWMYGSIAEPTG